MQRIPTARWQGRVSDGAFLEASSVYQAFKAVADCGANLLGHVLAVEFTSHSILYVTLAAVSHQSRIVGHVEEAWSEQV